MVYKQTKFLLFILAKTGKTKVIEIYTTDYNTFLGGIFWYGPWRKYTFNPAERTTFDIGCLQDIQSVMAELMAERLQAKIAANNSTQKLF